jgi:hypothetical protein
MLSRKAKYLPQDHYIFWFHFQASAVGTGRNMNKAGVMWYKLGKSSQIFNFKFEINVQNFNFAPTTNYQMQLRP